MGTSNDLISVIVPVYRVEEDLRSCVESIINQTYENLEIILVDDGSPDRCPQICDELSHIDSRIMVIHKENGGLSDARNAALEVCHGSYILFVDSDDLINIDMISSLYLLCVNNNSEMAVCDYISVPSKDFSYDLITSKIQKNGEIEELTPEAALSYMMNVYKTFQVAAWNKLYSASLFENIRYPVGIYYEDIATTYKLISKCTRVMYIHDALYYYQLRSNSITRSGFNKRDLDKVNNSTELLNYISQEYPSIKNEALVYKYVYCYMTILSKLLTDDKNENGQYINKFITEIKTNKSQIDFKIVPFKKRIAFHILLTNPELYKRLFLH